MLYYFLTFCAGSIAGGGAVFWWLISSTKGDAPPYLEDILKDDPVVTDRRLMRDHPP